MLENLYIKEILRSKEEKRILTGIITGIEDEYYKLKNKYIPCAILWYGDVKVLIPITHLRVDKQNKSIIRGMIGAEIDFIILEYDEVANIAIGSRKDAMELRSQIELPNLTEETMGHLIYFFEKACAMSGMILGVNPFNQPGVEKYKKNMFKLLEKPGY